MYMRMVPISARRVKRKIVLERLSTDDWTLSYEARPISPIGMLLEDTMPMLCRSIEQRQSMMKG